MSVILSDNAARSERLAVGREHAAFESKDPASSTPLTLYRASGPGKRGCPRRAGFARLGTVTLTPLCVKFALLRILPTAQSGQPPPRHRLLERLDDHRKIAPHRLTDQPMHVLGHHHSIRYQKPTLAAHNLQRPQEQIAAARAAQERLAAIATEGQEVQVAVAVVTRGMAQHARKCTPESLPRRAGFARLGTITPDSYSFHSGTRPGVHGAPAASICFAKSRRSTSTNCRSLASSTPNSPAAIA
jgi:hypothetical protein